MVLDDRACHDPRPRRGRDGMCDDAFMWGMWLGRGTAVSNGYNNRKQPIQQQIATDTTTGSNRYNSKKQPIQQQGATERKAGGRLSFLKKS